MRYNWCFTVFFCIGMLHLFSRAVAGAIGFCLYWFLALLTGIRAKFEGDMAFSPERKVYFANHNSHGDFVMVWISLPKAWRRVARPVAGADYWLTGVIRRFVINHVFNGLLIARHGGDPKMVTQQMSDALSQNASLIIFPEGTRNTSDDVLLLPFKSGIYHLACANPDVGFVPIWIDNINRVLPKGKLVPVPVLCNVFFGEPLHIRDGEEKDEFLQRARDAMLSLVPEHKLAQYRSAEDGR